MATSTEGEGGGQPPLLSQEKAELLGPAGKGLLGVRLKPGISRFTFFCYFMCNFEVVQNLALLATAGTSILTSRSYYHIDARIAGAFTGNLNFYTELYQITAEVLVGSFHDLFGRRIMMLLGYALIGFGVFLYPYSGEVYPWLFLVRICLAQGLTQIIVNPLVNDYVQDATKGVATAYGAIFGGLGAIFSMLFLLWLASHVPLETVFLISGSLTLLSFIYSFFFLRNNYERADRAEPFCRRFVSKFQ